MSEGTAFADEWWAFLSTKSRWEDGFDDLLAEGEDYDRLGTDDYDCSLEIRGAANDWRLSEAQQAYLFGAGFHKIYVNHSDGWETHYSASPVLPVRGWRRRYVPDRTATTTNVIAGEPNPGYYEISYWPSGWDQPGTKDWLATGYMRIVADVLDPFIKAPAHDPA